MQKLLYYAQAWNLVFNKAPLFKDKIEAWIHGPAIPEMYRLFKNFDFNNPPAEVLKENLNVFDAKEKKVLKSVWETYGKFDGDYLEILTHNELPWQEARKGLSSLDPSKNIISEERMVEYYEQKLAESDKDNKK